MGEYFLSLKQVVIIECHAEVPNLTVVRFCWTCITIENMSAEHVA